MKLTKLRLGALIVAFTLAVPALAVAVSPFVDVIPGKFYEAPVNWAASNGITTGSPSGSDTFKPDNPVTRGENVTFLKRYDDNIVQPADAALGTRIGTVEASVANLGQTVGTLNCNTSQVARWNGTNWVCNTVGVATSIGIDTNAIVNGSSTGTGQYSSITIGADNLPIISHYNSATLDLNVFHCADAACTAGIDNGLDTTGDVGAFTSIALGADNFAIVSYYDTTNGNLKAFQCGNSACNVGTVSTLDSGGDVGLFTSIAIGSDNLPIISYYDNTNGNLKVAHCTNTACSSGTATITAVDTTGDVGNYTSIAIGADGFAIISYMDITSAGLRAFHCANTNCTSGTATALDTNGTVGDYTSIAIGTDGFAIISYWDSSNSDLKAFHCANTNCTSGTATTLDSAGSVGLFTSITIGTDSLPIISYYDFTNSTLKVFHCADTACTSGTASTIGSITSGGDTGNYTSIAIGNDDSPIVSHQEVANLRLMVAHLTTTVTGIAFG